MARNPSSIRRRYRNWRRTRHATPAWIFWVVVLAMLALPLALAAANITR